MPIPLLHLTCWVVCRRRLKPRPHLVPVCTAAVVYVWLLAPPLRQRRLLLLALRQAVWVSRGVLLEDAHGQVSVCFTPLLWYAGQ